MLALLKSSLFHDDGDLGHLTFWNVRHDSLIGNYQAGDGNEPELGKKATVAFLSYGARNRGSCMTAE